MNLSPMMKQYEEAKAASGDAILLFRMGDFYELFHEEPKRRPARWAHAYKPDKGENPSLWRDFRTTSSRAIWRN